MLTDELDDRGWPVEYKDFVGPYVYMEEPKKEFEQMQAVLSSLPPSLVSRIVKHMNSYKAYMFLMNADQVEINYDTYYAVRIEVAIKKALRLGSRLASIFEVGEQQVLAKSFIRIAGVQVASLEKETCRSCGQAVRCNDEGCCPECGAVMGGG